MDSIDQYVYSINFENTTTLDREHSPYFCNEEAPKLPDLNNNSFEFIQGINPGITLDKYFGGNFKVIQLKDMKVDQTFDIYTRGRSKFQGKNKSYHYINDRNDFISSPNELSIELNKENNETPFKATNTQLLPNKKPLGHRKNNPNNQTTSINFQKMPNINNVSLKNVNDLSFHLKKPKEFKKHQAPNKKNLNPYILKEEKNSKENVKKSARLNIKEKELLKSYELAQLLRKENPENHIVFRKITHSLHKKPTSNLPHQKATNIDPLAEYEDLGMGKISHRSKNSVQPERKIKPIIDEQEGNTNKMVFEYFGRGKGLSRKELSKKFVKKQM